MTHSGFSYGVIEITPIRHKDHSVTFVDASGRIWWTEGQPVGIPVERRTVEGAPKPAPKRATKGRKRVTKDDFRELVKSRKRRKAA